MMVIASPSEVPQPSVDSASMCGSTTSSSVRLVQMPSSCWVVERRLRSDGMVHLQPNYLQANENRRPYCIITEPKSCSNAYKELMWPTTEQNAGWDALQHLRQGNLRCAHGRPRRPSLDQWLVPVRRRGPLAVVVCSTDGCLQPYKVFDLEDTDIVEVRVDGGVVSDAALASILMAVEVQGARLVLNLANDRDAVCRMAVEEAVQSGTYVMHRNSTDSGDRAPLGNVTPSSGGGGSSRELSVLARCRTSSEATGQQHPLLGLVENIKPAVRYVAERRYGELQARRAMVANNAPLLQCDQHTLHDVCKAHAAFGAEIIKSQLLKWLSPEVASELCVTSGMLECDKALVHFHH